MIYKCPTDVVYYTKVNTRKGFFDAICKHGAEHITRNST